MTLTKLYQQRAKSAINAHNALLDSLRFQYDYIISSFPRSGNTWVLKVLTTYTSINAGLDVDSLHQDKLIPDIHAHDISRFTFPDSAIFKAVKAHTDLSPCFNRSIVYIFRRPEDSLVSFYNFYLRYPHLRTILKDISIDEFCFVLLPEWIRHVTVAIYSSSENIRVLPVSYESLQLKTHVTYYTILKFLGGQVNENTLERAIIENEFSKLHSKEKQNLSEKHEGQCFFRKGVIGSGKEELRKSTLEYIKKFTDELYEQACLRQRDATFTYLKE